MLASFFRKEEKTLILAKLEEWVSLKGSGKATNKDGDVYSPRDRLVDGLVESLLRTFPERDLTAQPRSELVWPTKERDKLHSVRRCTGSVHTN